VKLAKNAKKPNFSLFTRENRQKLTLKIFKSTLFLKNELRHAGPFFSQNSGKFS